MNRPTFLLGASVTAANGAAVIIDERAIDTTTMHELTRANPLPAAAIGGVLLVVAAYSFWATWRSSAMWMLPQQAVLSLLAVGPVLAIAHSAYGDGVIRPRAFIAADQLPMILAAVFHLLAIVMKERAHQLSVAERADIEATRQLLEQSS